MHLLPILTYIAYLGLCSSSYEYVCPTDLGWRIRSKALCNSTARYSCLHDENKEISREICREKSSLLAAGNKYVIRGNLDGEACSVNRYQPFIFMTDKNNKCAILKSNCKEMGQIIYSNGSTTEDKSCRCDYSKNYAPIEKPNNPCYCVPSKEDCSCYLKLCPDKTHLSSDYACISDYTLVSLDECGLIKGNGESDKMMEIERNIDTKFRDRRANTLWLFVRVTVLAGVFLSALLVMISGSEDFKDQSHASDSEKGSDNNMKGTGEPQASDSKQSSVNGERKDEGTGEPQASDSKQGSVNGEKKDEGTGEPQASDSKQGPVNGEKKDEDVLDDAENTPGRPGTQDKCLNNTVEEQLSKMIIEKKRYLESETRILLIGKKGVGKSEIGKNIIEFGNRLHVTFSGDKIYTTTYTDINDTVYLVVDTSEFEKSSKRLEDSVKDCVYKTSPGPHAILFVMKATDMYKQEDYETFKCFLSYFCSEIRNYGIVVLTHGDKQNVAQRELNEVEEFFGKRSLVFNNEKMINNKLQVEALIKMIEKLKAENLSHYTDGNFSLCEKILQNMECNRQKSYSKEPDKRNLKRYENEKIRWFLRQELPKHIRDSIQLKQPKDSAATSLPNPKNPNSSLEEI